MEMEWHYLEQPGCAGTGKRTRVAARFDLHDDCQEIGIQRGGVRPADDILAPVLDLACEDGGDPV